MPEHTAAVEWTAAEREAEVERLRATVARVEALLARMGEHEWRLASTAHWRDALRAALEGDR